MPGDATAAAIDAIEHDVAALRAARGDLRSGCETLRHNIHKLQKCLCAMEGLTAEITDRSEREKLQGQVALLNRLLLLRLCQLSDTERSLQEVLGPVRSRRP